MAKPLKERKIHVSRMRNRNKILPDQTLTNAFVELYQLEEFTTDTVKEYQKNYATVRMVTIVEQFFREIVRLKIHKKPELIPDDSIGLEKSLIIDAFRQYGFGWPGSEGMDYEQLVEDFITKNQKHGVGRLYDGSISMKHTIIDKLIKHVGRHHTFGLKELLISSSFSFQSTHLIENNMKRFDILVFVNEQASMGLKKEDYDELFDARHMVVHTFNKTGLDIKTYLERIWRMFEHVLNRLPTGSVSFGRLKVAALHETKRYMEAIECLHNVVLGKLVNDWLCYYIGNSCRKIHDYLSARKYLTMALDQALLIECAAKYDNLQKKNPNEVERVLFDISLLYNAIGESFVAMKENDLAVKSLKCAMLTNPENISLYYSVGFSFRRICEYALAEQCYRKIISLVPDDAWAYIELGTVFLESNKTPQAKECYIKAAELNPNNDVARSWLNSLINDEKSQDNAGVG